MPRIRTIKPDFWDDEKLGQEPEAIMLTYIGLWNFSDDYGVVKANHLWLKNQIYPYKDKLRIDVFSSWLQRLSELEALISFTYRGESFYCIRTFRRHQKVEKPSKARNCPEDVLITEMNKCGFILNENQVFIKSGSSRGVVGEHSPLYIGKEKDIGKDVGGDTPTGDDGANAPTHTTEEENLFKAFKDWIENKAPKVNKMKEPFTIKQYLKLRTDFPGDKGRALLLEVISAMHNHKQLLKKYESANLTLRSWIKLREKNGSVNPNVTSNNGPSARELEEAENRKKLGIDGPNKHQ
jgi:hypothetical protein